MNRRESDIGAGKDGFDEQVHSHAYSAFALYAYASAWALRSAVVAAPAPTPDMSGELGRLSFPFKEPPVGALWMLPAPVLAAMLRDASFTLWKLFWGRMPGLPLPYAEPPPNLESYGSCELIPPPA